MAGVKRVFVTKTPSRMVEFAIKKSFPDRNTTSEKHQRAKNTSHLERFSKASIVRREKTALGEAAGAASGGERSERGGGAPERRWRVCARMCAPPEAGSMADQGHGETR